MNIGDRLEESKKINTSLLVLNKCFSVLRYVYTKHLHESIKHNYLLFKAKIKSVEKII